MTELMEGNPPELRAQEGQPCTQGTKVGSHRALMKNTGRKEQTGRIPAFMSAHRETVPSSGSLIALSKTRAMNQSCSRNASRHAGSFQLHLGTAKPSCSLRSPSPGGDAGCSCCASRSGRQRNLLNPPMERPAEIPLPFHTCPETERPLEGSSRGSAAPLGFVGRAENKPTQQEEPSSVHSPPPIPRRLCSPLPPHVVPSVGHELLCNTLQPGCTQQH